MRIIKLLFSLMVIPLFLFTVNAMLIWPLFSGGYTSQMGSIESVFIADARFIAENFPNLSWNPYWYTGFPFHLFYTPFLPYLMVLLHACFSSIPLESWYRILIGFFYAATPISVYFLVRYLLKNTAAGFLSAMIFAFAPTVGYLMPGLSGTAEAHNFAPWRFLTMILYGEGGHIIGLFFLPLAILFTFKTLRQGNLRNYLMASIFIAFVALTNMISLMGLTMMLMTVFIIEDIGQDWQKKAGRSFLLVFYSFGLVSFWYNLSFMKASLSIGTGGAGGSLGEVYFRFLPFIFLLIPLVFLFALAAKKENWKLPLITVTWVVLFFSSAYFWFTKEVMLLPQPNRYLPEMDMGMALFLSWGIFLLIEKIIPKLVWAKGILYTLITILILYLPLRYINQVWNLTQPHQAIEQTSEYKIASWLKNNTDGERVYASGSTAFWLNTFFDVPQVRGGNDGLANPWVLHAIYQINTGENAPLGKEAEIALSWLRILNVSYLVVNTPQSSEVFHDFKKIERFTENPDLTKIIDLKGDVIYKVPLVQPSLAQVVSKTNFVNLKPLKNAVDYSALQDYLIYIDNNKLPEANFTWFKNGQAKITANLDKEEGVALQIPYSSGWQAFSGQEKIAIKKDPLGFMLLEPKATGNMEITLTWHKTGDIWLGYLLTIMTVIGFIAYPFLTKRLNGLFKQAKAKWEEDKDEDE
ncbi:MAG: hypothetical protein M1575_03095 [Patescibacteria group bacterium]|nr:hypothetical protein [Patescibacteria group bacterium]MCL5095689.1 hypothetical protein [Patescibacteria group bacterium]